VMVAPAEKIVTDAGPRVTPPPATRINSAPPEKYAATGVTPLPSSNSDGGLTATAPAPAKYKMPASAPPVFPRYLYLSPGKPAAGDRVAASGAFTRARVFEQGSHWTDAMEWYRRAAESDASWFEAQYNYGVLAYRLRNFPAALSAYETALAIQPGSADARYNFALTLKAAGYAVDAVNELEKILAANPDEVRVQLALGNLYAQQLRNPAKARPHYLKVLELDPRNPQSTDIRYWLAANPA
jgi:tetratricopeptide (TPR) repeat protein